MPYKIKFSDELLTTLHSHKIMFKVNSPPPKGGLYGWVKEGAEVLLPSPVHLEQNSGLYGGGYRGLVGGGRATGLNSIGSFSYSYSSFPHGVTIGRYCSISSGLKVLDSAHPIDTITSSAIMFRPRNSIFKDHITVELKEYAKEFPIRPLTVPVIENDVWIGANVTLAPHIIIGTGAVIAAGSMVTKDVEPYTIIGGNPAKPIKRRFSDSICQSLLDSKWWNYSPDDVFSQDPTDIKLLATRISQGELSEYRPWSISLGDYHPA